jgi:triosephosphate isomerase (TIM)
VSGPGASRRPLVSGNWKMHLDHLEAIHTVSDLNLRLQPADVAAVDVSIHPPFTDLRSVQTLVEKEDIPVALGAQNCASEDAGAFTGEVSPVMLAKLRVDYVIVGHSERRRIFGEDDDLVAAKAAAVVRNGMTPICCVGETEEERDAAATKDRLTTQVSGSLASVSPEVVARSVMAYEPVWAIGTGRAASAEDAQEACAWIRELVADRFGAEAAAGVRIQYGGSVNPDNTEDLLRCPDVDGVLVGGASLEPASFVDIVRAAAVAVR